MNNVLNHDIPFQRYFEEITRIPHGSFNEGKIADYLKDFAAKNNLDFYRDDVNNCIIKKNGTGALQNAEPVILQAHTDMVCVKTKESTHNFETDALPIYVEGTRVKTKGTTLGGDDGTGVATMLALLTDEFEHPPIEAVFTVQEEVGMFGAKAFDYSRLKGKKYISLDCGGENKCSVNAAGCETMTFIKPVKFEAVSGELVTLNISGLAGGHSGGCIGEERGNALKITARAMRKLIQSGINFSIVSITGGQATNAIPDSCVATLCTVQKQEVVNTLNYYCEAVKTTLFEADKNYTFDIKDSCTQLNGEVDTKANTGAITNKSEKYNALTQEDTQQVVNLLCAMPNGVQRKSVDIENFVTASYNVAKIETNSENIRLFVSARGASELILDELEDTAMLITAAFGFSGKVEERTPCWEYNPNSELRKTASKLMEKEWGVPLVPEFTHSGLECGYFAKNIKDLDMVSIGAFWYDIHTPNEQMCLSSAQKVYGLLKNLLTELA